MLNPFAQFFYNQYKKNEAKIHTLRYLFWECTQRCNLQCRHCGSDCTNHANIPDMPFADFLQAILPLQGAYKRNSIMVAITGGEPLLRQDLPQCGKALRNHGFRWGVVTNGYQYTPDMHARLLGAGMESITLSLDGFEATHNWLRANPKSFENAVKALELITATNRLRYDVVTCVNQKNIGELSDLKAFLWSKKVRAWRLFTIAPIGRGAYNRDLALPSEALKQMMDFIAHARKDKRMDLTFSCEAYVGKYEGKVRDDYFFCRAGIHIASILIDGSISACPNIDRHFVQGNIYDDRFLEVWNNRFDLMRNRNWTQTGICLHCKDYKHCNGGALHLWNDRRDTIMTCINKQLG
jgi:radical SAM enzyme (rSAM/lipoprotein system)